jgi:ribosomal protein S18 acetylase RimI-like enzyme
VLGRVREAISSEEVLVVLVRSTAPAGPVVGDGLSFRRLSHGAASSYAAAIGTDSAATFAARLSETTRCYGVELEGRLVHASWVTTGCAWTRELRSFVCPTPGEAYVYESFTRADARGRGVYPFALHEICRALHAEGTPRLWIAVESHNEPSLRAVTKAGFERVFEIFYRRRLGRLVVRLPDAVKTDTRANRVRKKQCISLSGDGARKQ